MSKFLEINNKLMLNNYQINTLTFLFICKELPRIFIFISPDIMPNPLFFPFNKFSLIFTSIWFVFYSKAILFSFFTASLIFGSIDIYIYSIPMTLTLYPISLVYNSIWICFLAFSVLFVF